MEVNEFIDKFVKDPGLNSILKGLASQFTATHEPCKIKLNHKIYDYDSLMNPMEIITNICHENAKEKGFWENRHPAEAIALIHSELSELLEAFRLEKPPFDNFEVMSDKTELANTPLVLEELADVAIRVFDMAGQYFKPSAFALTILRKMKYNNSRPFKHGKSF